MAHDLLLKNSSQRNHVKIDAPGVLRIGMSDEGGSREYVTKTEAIFFQPRAVNSAAFIQISLRMFFFFNRLYN